MRDDAQLTAAARSAFERRAAPVAAIATDAMAVSLACRSMADRFIGGGRLLVFGSGSSAPDAEHIAVEFVHPVIVGKRALPALSLASDAATMSGIAASSRPAEMFGHQLETLGRSGDIALGLTTTNDTVGLREGFAAARNAGLLTISLSGASAGVELAAGEVDHAIVVQSDDPLVVREAQVTIYHVLWELVHVFFDTPDVDSEAADGVASLYPFLYGASHDPAEVLASVAASTEAKVAEVGVLRTAVGEEIAEALAGCAQEVADRVVDGATMWSFGNGGSSTDAQAVTHVFLHPPAAARAIGAICLSSDSAVVTALSNDVGFGVVFSRQIAAFGRAGDIAIGLSTSGGSANVIDALEAAKQRGMTTIGIAGYGGGRMAESISIDHMFAVSSTSVHRVQEVQTTIYQVLWELTSRALADR